MNQPSSQKFLDIELELMSLAYASGHESVVARLESIVQNPEDLSEAEQQIFRDRLLIKKRAVDPDYRPLQRSHYSDVTPLEERYHYCRMEQPDEAEKALWKYIQHCSFGTARFQDAICLLVRYAVECDNLSLARHAAQLLLHHYAIVNIMRYNPLMPPGFSEPYEDIPEEIVDNEAEKAKYESDIFESFCFPYWEAIEALEIDGAQCWVDMLEITAEITSLERRKEFFYPKVLEALRAHYHKIGNLGRLEWLKAYDLE